MVEVKNLTKKYGSFTAVEDLSFTVENGCIYGLLGPNGAGKSTTMNIMTGCLASTGGQVLIDGKDIFEDETEAKKKIGYLPEIPPLYPDMTVTEYLRFVGRAKGLKGEELKNAVETSCEKTGLNEKKHSLIKNLSKGFKQRVGIAQAIIAKPDVVILDEPTVGLDPIQITEIRDLIRELGKEHTVIISSHILSEISTMCDHILIISRGKLVASDTPDALYEKFASKSKLDIVIKGGRDTVPKILSSIEHVKSVTVTKNPDENAGDKYVLLTENGEDVREKVFSLLKDTDCSILEMKLVTPTLEDVFITLTSEAK
ncbi:MAG: ABC transporter ATP-binding protein [Oscillospiraceae bacterium]|nr:ABC transporter ATP-binding protein [Oscillospiraceae bacterium]MDY3938321.1 ABC transporter ATP-binding protein [Oscillospiraceae bacterium]